MVNKKFENIKKKSQIFIKCVPILVLLLGQKAYKLFFVQSQFCTVQISTRLISSPLRALFVSLRVPFGGSQLL